MLSGSSAAAEDIESSCTERRIDQQGIFKTSQERAQLQAQREELKRMQDELKPFMDAKAAESGDMLGAMIKSVRTMNRLRTRC